MKKQTPTPVFHCVLGLDQSYTCTGITIRTADAILFASAMHFSSKESYRERRLKLRRMLHRLCIAYPVDLIVVEGIRLFSQGVVSPATIMTLSGLIVAVVDGPLCEPVCYHEPLCPFLTTVLPVRSADTRSWRSKTVGSAKASKEDTIEWAEEQLAKLYAHTTQLVHPVSHDLADSVGIATYPFCVGAILHEES